MPLYEYYCPTCSTTFESLRPAQHADAPAACPECRDTSSQRILSLFARSVKTSAAMPALSPAPTGGSCCGGACGCAH